MFSYKYSLNKFYLSHHVMITSGSVFYRSFEATIVRFITVIELSATVTQHASATIKRLFSVSIVYSTGAVA
jgi:hypothetical protein